MMTLPIDFAPFGQRLVRERSRQRAFDGAAEAQAHPSGAAPEGGLLMNPKQRESFRRMFAVRTLHDRLARSLRAAVEFVAEGDRQFCNGVRRKWRQILWAMPPDERAELLALDREVRMVEEARLRLRAAEQTPIEGVN